MELGKGYISYSSKSQKDTKYVKCLPVAINPGRDIIYCNTKREPHCFSSDYKFIGYEIIDLKKAFNISDKYIEAENAWAKIKKSNAFIPDKVLALYNFAKVISADKNRRLDLKLWEDNGETYKWADIHLYYDNYDKVYDLSHYYTPDEKLTCEQFKTLKSAFNRILDILQEHQVEYAEFKNVDADENFFEEEYKSLYHLSSSTSHRDYSDLEPEEQAFLKTNASKLKDHFLNAYYFKYKETRTQDHFSGPATSRVNIKEVRILAKTQEEAEKEFYENYDKGGRINSGLWYRCEPLSTANKTEIEELKRKIIRAQERIKELEKETPKDLVRVDTGF